MAKAKLVLPDGTKVDIEGTAEEVARLLTTFAASPAASPAKRPTARKSRSKGTSKSPSTPKRKGPQALIAELAGAGYFKSKRTIGDIQKKLEEKGHIYAQQSLSSPLIRLTRNKTLRRIKEKGNWVYVA